VCAGVCAGVCVCGREGANVQESKCELFLL